MRYQMKIIQICRMFENRACLVFLKCGLNTLNLPRSTHQNIYKYNWSRPISLLPNIHFKYTTNILNKCWKCGHKLQSLELFCKNCNVVQKPEVMSDYYQILGLEKSFDIDMKDLTQKYRQLQSLLHPDKFSSKSEQEKHISEEISAFVNRAYDNLKNPLNRAIHLLELKGQTINENENACDKDFLIEIMERNEELESASTAVAILNLRKKNNEELDQLNQDVSGAFKNNNIGIAKKLIIKMKYFTSIDDRLKLLIRKHGIIE